MVKKKTFLFLLNVKIEKRIFNFSQNKIEFLGVEAVWRNKIDPVVEFLNKNHAEHCNQTVKKKN